MPSRYIDQRVQTTCLVILTVLAVGGALYWLRPVMIPFVLAVFLAYVLALDFMRRA